MLIEDLNPVRVVNSILTNNLLFIRDYDEISDYKVIWLFYRIYIWLF